MSGRINTTLGAFVDKGLELWIEQGEMTWEQLKDYEPYENAATGNYLEEMQSGGYVTRIAISDMAPSDEEGIMAFFLACACGGMLHVILVAHVKSLGDLRKYKDTATPLPNPETDPRFRENMLLFRDKFLLQLPFHLHEEYRKTLMNNEDSFLGSGADSGQQPSNAGSEGTVALGTTAGATVDTDSNGSPTIPDSFDTNGLMASGDGEPAPVETPLAYPDMAPPGTQTHLHGRWVRQKDGTASWGKCNVPITLERIAPSTPVDPAHWHSRAYPDGRFLDYAGSWIVRGG